MYNAYTCHSERALAPTQLKQTENRHTPGTFSFPTKIRKKIDNFLDCVYTSKHKRDSPIKCEHP